MDYIGNLSLLSCVVSWSRKKGGGGNNRKACHCARSIRRYSLLKAVVLNLNSLKIEGFAKLELVNPSLKRRQRALCAARYLTNPPLCFSFPLLYLVCMLPLCFDVLNENGTRYAGDESGKQRGVLGGGGLRVLCSYLTIMLTPPP